MGYASTLTLIPIDRLAFHLQVDPYHFNSIYTTTRPFNPSCEDDWYQHDWQSTGKISRESLATALREAEDLVSTYLRYFPVPRWITDEEQQVTPHYAPELYSDYNAKGRAKSILTKFGYVITPGKRTSTYIATPITVFVDMDGDGFFETIQITFNTTVTDPEELYVYYPGKDGREEWEIRPLTNISIAAGVATITFPKYLIALEDLLEVPADPDDPHIGIDGDDDNNFLSEVDVYRVYTDTTDQVDIYYEPIVSCDTPCTYTTEAGCLYIKNSRLGILAYQPPSTSCYNNPNKMVIHYFAGYKDNRLKYPTRQMDTTLERMICYFALYFLDTRLGGCSNTKNIWEYQTQDIAKVDPQNGSFASSWAALDNPFGTSRAALRLWKHITPMRIAAPPI